MLAELLDRDGIGEGIGPSASVMGTFSVTVRVTGVVAVPRTYTHLVRSRNLGGGTNSSYYCEAFPARATLRCLYNDRI